MRLSVHLLTYNGAKYIPYLFDSLRAQTFKDWQLLVIDNGSENGTLEAVRNELKNFSRPHHIIENKENVGFAKGHNAMLTTNYLPPNTNYILLLNQDVILAPDYFEKLLEFMEANPEAGSAQGALLRWRFEEIKNIEVGGLTDTVDTLGLKVLRSRRVMDWRTGRQIGNWKLEIGSLPLEIFGVSGALPIYRRKALDDVAISGQVFDEDFFMYKEDVDLAYRLRSAGWRAYLVFEALAWHDRTSSAIREEKQFVNYHSYKNHLFALIKNEYFANFLRDLPWITWYEFRKLIYLLFFERQTLKSLKDFWQLLPRVLKKRKIIKSKRKLFAREMRKWFIHSSAETEKNRNKVF